jgi:ArsR family transcriptional regulator, arsenate/arsenite/antimonite-responsive transcriptional repressor
MEAPLSDLDLVRLARALADPTRVRILRTVAGCGTVCCGAITREVPVRPATISHHLRVLAEAGLVETERDGQFINVRVNPNRFEQFRTGLSAVIEPRASHAGRNGRRRTRREP